MAANPGETTKVGIAVIAYNATATIAEVLDRLPSEIDGAVPAVLVADDESSDDTAGVARAWVHAAPDRGHVEVVRRPVNLGYGGNQMACFRWAIDRGLEVVVLVHGDGQYPPEVVPELVAPILAGTVDACFGSRMLVRGGAREGRMPVERRIGNRVLSTIQNLLTGAKLSEWHSGFRAYRVETLEQIDFGRLSSGFDADTAMTLELLDLGARMSEIPIPTRYAGEISYLNPWTTGLRILTRTARHRWR